MKKFSVITLCIFGVIVLIFVSAVSAMCFASMKIPFNVSLQEEKVYKPNQLPAMRTVDFAREDQKSETNPQIFSTLLGFTSFDKTPLDGMFVTENGLYVVDKANHNNFYLNSDKPYGAGMNLSVTRWDTEGNFEWEYVIDHDIHFQNYWDVIIQDVCVDDDENIYLMGSFDRMNRRFFLHQWVPLCRTAFVFCLSKNQEVQWVRFLSDEYEKQNLVFHKNKLYVVLTRDYNGVFWDGPPNCIRCMSSDNGRKLWSRSVQASSFDLVHTDESGLYLLTREENRTLHLHCYNWEGQKQWSSEILNSNTVHSGKLPKQLTSRFVVSCNSNNDHVYLSFSNYFLDTTNGTLSSQTYSLHSINREGEIEWTQTNQPNESTCIVDIQCQDNLLCIVSQTNTDGLSTENAFQKQRKGDSDLLLSIVDVNGRTQWKTYVGGMGLEPYYGLSIYYPTHPYYCGLLEDRIVVACSTSSRDFPVFHAPHPQFYTSPEKTQDAKLPHSYNVVFVFDVEGHLKWSTYTTSDNLNFTDEEDSQRHVSQIFGSQPNGNRVKAVQIMGEYLYIIEFSDNPAITLNDPKQQTLTFDTLASNYLMEIFSRYQIK